MLSAAAAQFIQLGFERTSVEAVAQASGVSKMTVYSYFPSKEALFEACIEDRCCGLFDIFINAGVDPAQPQAALERIGTLFLALLREDDVLAMHRMMFASATVHPDVSAFFYQLGPAKSLNHLEQFLSASVACGSLAVPDPARAADQFLSMFLGSGHMRAMLGMGKPDAIEDARIVADNVATFLRAYAPV